MDTEHQYCEPSQLSSDIPRVSETQFGGLLVLTPKTIPVRRRVLFVNVGRGPAAWTGYASGMLPSSHLWGCIELLRLGYEVGIASPLPDFYLTRNPFPHDIAHLKHCRGWLRSGDIVYCAHNTLYWIPLLRRLGFGDYRIVGLLYAREPLNQAKGHDGIIALTPAAERQARRAAPRARVGRLAWGADLAFSPSLPFSSRWFLACGRTHRDTETLRAASDRGLAKIRLIEHAADERIAWPPNVDVTTGGPGWDRRIPYPDFLQDYYSGCIASLVILNADPAEYTACGFTSLLEAMAMGRPVIMTKTNAVPGEIDIERAGCGLWVPPGDPAALHRAMAQLAADPGRAQQMGEKGRELCRSYYNMQRFGTELHQFFESL